MNAATSAAKPSHRKIADEPLLRDMAVGLIRGEFKDPTNAAKAVLRAHGFNNDAHEESNVRRLTEKYREEHWHAKGLEEVIQQEIRERGMTVKPATDDPDVLRMWLIETLNEVIEGYNDYGRMVTEKQTDCYGDQYLFEDYLHDWDRSLGDHGRCAVEQLVSSIVPAIHRFYETALVMEDHGADKNGISGHYPVTKVSFVIDASQPLPVEDWARNVPGVVGDGRFKIEYSNPAMPDSRWLAPATARFREFLQRDDRHNLPRHMWSWPVKALANSDTVKVTFGYVPQQGASSYSTGW